MEEIIKKILNKLPKGTLVTIIIISCTLLFRYWLRDYKSNEQEKLNLLLEIKDEQKSIKTTSNSRFDTLIFITTDLKLGQDKLNEKVDIIQEQSEESIKNQLKQVDDIYIKLEEYKSRDQSFYQLPVRTEVTFKTEPQELTLNSDREPEKIKKNIFDEINLIKKLLNNDKK